MFINLVQLQLFKVSIATTDDYKTTQLGPPQLSKVSKRKQKKQSSLNIQS